jgi:xanthine dehydrogenase large subunit
MIKARMAEEAARRLGLAPDAIAFFGGLVGIAQHHLAFGELAKACHLERIPLSATGFFKTPGITWNRLTKTGEPFQYFAYGAACSEVMIDTLTGEMRLLRVDLLQDCGASLNPAIDQGQIEGGFVQGLGWLTTEEIVFDAKGRLLTHAPSTYKIPVASDVPAEFRTAFWHVPNRVPTIGRSKAVGEPPLMLAISAFLAIADAVHSAAPGKPVALRAPATPEAILDAILHQRGEAP